jgi:hypothetical protein
MVFTLHFRYRFALNWESVARHADGPLPEADDDTDVVLHRTKFGG